MTVRERIWRYIDDSEPERHGALRDALYRLLVAIEAGREPLAPGVDRCLDLAAEALRDGSAVAVLRARMVVDDLVIVLASGAIETVAERIAC
jgi:hypothetical protein